VESIRTAELKKQGLSFYIGKIRKCLKWKIAGKEIFKGKREGGKEATEKVCLFVVLHI